MALTDEEQRYAKAWAKRGRLALIVMVGLGIQLVAIGLGTICQAIGIKWATVPALILIFLGFGAWASAALYYRYAFQCPRCGKPFGSRDWRLRSLCRHCELPFNAPHNPDPNWKTS